MPKAKLCSAEVAVRWLGDRLSIQEWTAEAAEKYSKQVLDEGEKHR